MIRGTGRRRGSARQRAIVLFVLLAAVPGARTAERDSLSTRFARANAAYQGGDYTGAEAAYRSLLAAGVDSAPLYYNLANACFKQRRLGEAVLYWESARRRAPRDEETLENLAFANLLVVDRIDVPPTPWPLLAARTATTLLSSTQESWLLLASFFAANLLVSAYLLSRSPRVAIAALVGAGVLLLFATLCAASIGWKAWESATLREAVVVDLKADARSGPGQDNVTVFAVHEGTIMRIRSENSGWFQVSLPNGWNGWIHSSALREIR